VLNEFPVGARERVGDAPLVVGSVLDAPLLARVITEHG